MRSVMKLICIVYFIVVGTTFTSLKDANNFLSRKNRSLRFHLAKLIGAVPSRSDLDSLGFKMNIREDHIVIKCKDMKSLLKII